MPKPHKIEIKKTPNGTYTLYGLAYDYDTAVKVVNRALKEGHHSVYLDIKKISTELPTDTALDICR